MPLRWRAHFIHNPGPKHCALEQKVSEHLGFEHVLQNVGQVYPRSLDLDVIAALLQVASGPKSFATTLRLMAGAELGTEGFKKGQVGSSASIFTAWVTAFEYEFVVTFILVCFESSIVNKDLATVIVIAWKLVDHLIINHFRVIESSFFQFHMIVYMKFHDL